jgi:hypothetical protein
VTATRPRCPVCSRRVALVASKLARHQDGDGEACPGSGRTTFEATIILAKQMATARRAQAQAAVLGRSRRSVLTFDGDTGEHTLAPASWRVDVGEPEGHTVRGLVDPEHEDLPPCCAAPTPTDS